MNDSVFYECEEVAASVTATSLEPTLGEPRDFNHFPACRGVLTISLPGVFVLTVLIPHKNSLKEEELVLLLLLFVCSLFVFGVVILVTPGQQERLYQGERSQRQSEATRNPWV